MKNLRPALLVTLVIITLSIWKLNQPQNALAGFQSEIDFATPSLAFAESSGTGQKVPGGPLIPPSIQRRSSSLEDQMSEAEQKSLHRALSEARREVREIPVAWADRPENVGHNFYALHPAQNLTARFGEGGAHWVSSDRTYTAGDAENETTSWEAKMRLHRFAGREVVGIASPQKVAGSRIVYERGLGVTEWFNNGEEAMEHGFTVAARPGHLGDGEEVVIEVDLEGLVSAEKTSDSDTDLVFLDGDREVLGYNKLVVFDAAGRELPARMAATKRGFLLAYQDNGARYPITVDPLIVNEEAKINRVNAGPSAAFGSAVAISGNTVVIGSSEATIAGSNSGCAYVFFRLGLDQWTQQAKLNASDAGAGDRLGFSVSISGETVAVSADRDDNGVLDTGSVCIFIREGGIWGQQAKLTATDGQANDWFGTSVSIFENTVLVGALGGDDRGLNSGSCYLFQRNGNTWTQEAKLLAPDGAMFDAFGQSVALSSDLAVVGATGDDDGGNSAGSVYLFSKAAGSWSYQGKLFPSDSAEDQGFGKDVAISGTRIIVGAWGDATRGGEAGAAYIFVRSGNLWIQEAKFVAGDGAEQDRFGVSVGISGDTAVVGAFADDDRGGNSGSAYIYFRSGGTWFLGRKLTASDGAAFDSFGQDVAISGNTIVVGAPQDDVLATNSGSAYIFTGSGFNWTEQIKVGAPDEADEDFFGMSVALSGFTLAVGAHQDDDAGSGTGSVYVFTRKGTQWSQQAKLTGFDSLPGSRFGYAISLSGDSLVVGSPGQEDGLADRNSGRLYVFTRTDQRWSLQAKLSAADAETGDNLGYSVAISGDALVAGAPFEGQRGSNAGSAYVFERSGSTWSQQNKLLASNAASDAFFGSSVAIDGTTLAIGATRSEGDGAAYIFTKSIHQWTEQAKLTASDGSPDDFFGTSVALAGDTLVVGASQDDQFNANSGSAYVFVRAGISWSQQAKLNVPDARPDDNFGASVAISGSQIVIGAHLSALGGGRSGAAAVFQRNGTNWTWESTLVASDAEQNSTPTFYFGPVAISGDTVVIGAGRDDAAFPFGSAYVYRLSPLSFRTLLVSDHLNNAVSNGGRATPFGTQQIGSSQSFVFTLSNLEQLGLDLQTITLGGANAGEFSLSIPNISANPDLAQSQSLTIIISFQPTGTSGLRDAILTVTSNDSTTPVYSINLSGLGLSTSGDSDNDGMNDWAEFGLRGFGFDWTIAQDNLVDDYYAMAPRAGLVPLDGVASLHARASLLSVNPASNRAKFSIQLQQSPDLNAPFSPISIDPSRLSVDAQGRLVYEVDAPAGKRFYLMEIPE